MHGNTAVAPPADRPLSARERIIEAAYDLFSRQGTRAVGVDAIIERSGVAKMTLYRHFRSKQDLVLAFLQRREQLWTMDWLAREIRARATDPKGRLLAVFDVFHDWFQSPTFEGSPFINVLLEYEADNKIHEAAAHYHKLCTEIYYVLEGTGTLELDRDRVEVEPGTLVVIEPLTIHRLVSENGVKIMVIGVPALDPDDEYLVAP